MDIGTKLKRMRMRLKLTQEELADRCELSKGFISQVERNLTSPSIATLTDLLECLGSNLRTFFSENQDEKVVFHAEDMFIKEDNDALKGQITWLVPNAQKNMMEPMLVELGAGGRTQLFPPHEGEEIGFVLSGALHLRMGGIIHRVKAGESFCIHPEEPHDIINPGKKPVKFLWVSTPPSF
ncbi:MAG: cupin domain-containing protein [Clostridiales bacterium]|jgi:transcriptional regulator with XRE-family HTH domain|nr:cupin domain-containing protein [Clostridiales bacterium]